MHYKTPGVHIVEKNAFPSSVVAVETAVPAFVGYTQRADNAGNGLARQPWRIGSLAEYEHFFGDPAQARFSLHDCLALFFLNGGGPCYIVSVGDYSAAVESDALSAGIDLLLKEQEPTLLVIPEAMLLDEPECIEVQQAMLAHCAQMQSRMAILDVWGGWKSRSDGADCVADFRDHIGDRYLDYAAAYYPWLNTAAAGQADRLLPPGAAIAGIYTMVDNTRGVWKAPANVCLAGITSPSVVVTSQEQEDLNTSLQGKSINAIRSFGGEGVLVWGGRTLDGNSPDWRYVNVRRTMIMIEQSCKLAMRALVFEPNTANTWVTAESMLLNFLTGIWKQGGLAGATPADAFDVRIGLGETMTADDILDGILRVAVRVAVVRPAEFIQITFQQMQTELIQRTTMNMLGNQVENAGTKVTSISAKMSAP